MKYYKDHLSFCFFIPCDCRDSYSAWLPITWCAPCGLVLCRIDTVSYLHTKLGLVVQHHDLDCVHVLMYRPVD